MGEEYNSLWQWLVAQCARLAESGLPAVQFRESVWCEWCNIDMLAATGGRISMMDHPSSRRPARHCNATIWCTTPPGGVMSQ